MGEPAVGKAGQPAAPRGIRTRGPQAVTFVELFFDLVFVFAVTQVTALTAHDLTAEGILRSVLLGWLIWWAWTQFTWTLNPADTTHAAVRIVTLAATGGAFVMAASVPQAFSDDALWFAVPYLVMRGLGLGLQLFVEFDRPGAKNAAIFRWTGASLVGLVLVLVGALADPSLRSPIWLAAIAADVGAAAIAGRRASWDLNPAHLAERHGLFVIIALGESLIIAGTAVAGDVRTLPLVTAVGAAIAIACLLWWSYFGWLKDALEHRFARTPNEMLGPTARDAFSLAHFPLIAGIVGFAAAIEEIVVHPDEPADVAVVAALGIGVVLFVASSAVAYRRLGGPWLLGRLAILGVMIAALVPAASMSPAVPLAVVAGALLAIVVLEEMVPPEVRAAASAALP